MRKRRVPKTVDFGADYEQVRLLGIKLRALAHLIGNQAIDEPVPLDFLDVTWGTGLVLQDIAASLRDLSRSMEAKDMRQSRK